MTIKDGWIEEGGIYISIEMKYLPDFTNHHLTIEKKSETICVHQWNQLTKSATTN